MNDSLFSEAELDPELLSIEGKKKERERLSRIEKEKAKEEVKESGGNGRTIYLLDGYSIIYRSYFAHMAKPIMDRRGVNISAYAGFFMTLLSLVGGNSMDALAVTMDEKGPTFRHEMYPEYKANRDKAPDDLHASVQPIKDTLGKMGIPVLSKKGFEADDIMASVARKAAGEGWNVVIVTGDKDLCQLVGERITALRPPKKGETGYTFMDAKGVYDYYGVKPEQIVDYLSILGDASDNVPGIKGLGEKSAVRLLSEYLSLDGIYRHLDSLKAGERKKLEEGREMAELSRKLVKLSFDAVPDTFSFSSSLLSSFTMASASSDFEERDLKRLSSQVKSPKYNGGGTVEEEESGEEKEEERKAEPLLSPGERYLLEKGSYSVVASARELEKKLEKILSFGSGTISLEFLSDGYTPSSPVLGFAFSPEPLEAYYVSLTDGSVDTSDAVRLLSSFSSRGSIIAHSGGALLSRARTISFEPSVSGDTMLEAWMLNSNEGVYSLEFLVSRYFSQTLLPLDALKEKDDAVAVISESDRARYTSLRADYIMRLDRVFSRRMHEAGLMEAYSTMELPLIPVLSAMEKEGIYLSSEKMEEMAEKGDGRLRELTESIWREAGYEFNVNSPMQLSKLLFEERGLTPGKKTRRWYSTDTATLEGLSSSGDPLIRLLLEYRQLSKLKSTYIDTLPLLRDGRGRVHTSFLQTGTATGRLSSRNPNLQNIPVRTDEGRLIRSAFVPEEGNVFVSADYSQIELVVLSWLSGDKALQEAFLRGEDVHRYTAGLIFEKDTGAVTPSERRVAKTINFGIMYGMSAFRLASELEISRSDATDFITRYFQRYSGVRTFVEEAVRKAEADGYVRTYWGHMREIIGITSRNRTEKAAAERTAVNTIIQGSAAEIMKKAMLRVSDALSSSSLSARLLLQVHDELIFEVKEEDADALEALLREAMEGAVTLPVPLRVSIERGRSWGDMH